MSAAAAAQQPEFLLLPLPLAFSSSCPRGVSRGSPACDPTQGLLQDGGPWMICSCSVSTSTTRNTGGEDRQTDPDGEARGLGSSSNSASNSCAVLGSPVPL